MKIFHQKVSPANDVLMSMARQCPDGCWYEDLSDPKQSWISDAFWQSLGCSAPHAKPGSILDIWVSMISPDQAHLIRKKLNDFCKSPESPFDEVVHFLSPDGRPIWMKCQLLALESDQGGVTGLVCWHSDVTDLMMTQFLQDTSNRVANIGYWQVELRTMLADLSDISLLILGLENGKQVPIADVLAVISDSDNSQQIKRIFDDIVKTGQVCDEEVAIGKDQASQRWVRLIGFPEIIQGECRRLYGTIQDVTEKKIREEALWESEEAFRNNFMYAGIGMALVATDGAWLQVNRTLCGILGYSESELMKLTFQDVTHPEDIDKDLALLNEVIDGVRDHYQMEKRYFHKNGNLIHVILSVSVVRNKDQTIKNFVSQIIDISDLHEAQRKVTGLLQISKEQNKELLSLQNQLRQANRVLMRENQTDPLTGLGNRRAFHIVMEDILNSPSYQSFCLAMIDVDFFKKYNDTYGHLEGDRVLKKLGNVLSRFTREEDKIIRFGGEEFSMIMPDVTLAESLIMAERLRQEIENQVFPNQGITISIGVSSRQPEDDTESMLKRADEALYLAKSKGRNCVSSEKERSHIGSVNARH